MMATNRDSDGHSVLCFHLWVYSNALVLNVSVTCSIWRIIGERASTCCSEYIVTVRQAKVFTAYSTMIARLSVVFVITPLRFVSHQFFFNNPCSLFCLADQFPELLRFPVTAARVWNSLPHHVMSTPSPTVYQSRLKTYMYLFSRSFLWLH